MISNNIPLVTTNCNKQQLVQHAAAAEPVAQTNKIYIMPSSQHAAAEPAAQTNKSYTMPSSQLHMAV